MNTAIAPTVLDPGSGDPNDRQAPSILRGAVRRGRVVGHGGVEAVPGRCVAGMTLTVVGKIARQPPYRA